MTDVTAEIDGLTLRLTNLDKHLFPDGFTKAEVIDYYVRIAPVLLPHLGERCITRLRFPEGSAGPSFYEKNVPSHVPDWVRVQRVLATADVIDYPVATRVADLVWLANLAALELHTPQWRIPDTAGGRSADPSARRSDSAASADAPDADTGQTVGSGQPVDLDAARASMLVVDLDPGPGVTRPELAEAAMIVATDLAGEGLIPFAKTSGAKGLQVHAPIQPTPAASCVAHVQAMARRLSTRHPERFVAVMAKEQRPNRVFVDYLQNQAARNTISVYSLRGRERAQVATPVTWDEVAAVRGEDDLRFTPADVLRRVEEHGDLWAEALEPHAAATLPDPS